MSEGAKASGWLAAVLAILTLLLSTQGLGFLQWAQDALLAVIMLPMFIPVSMAVFVGAAMSSALPHFAPDSWSRRRTMAWTRVIAGFSAFFMVAFRHPTPIGIQYGIFAASGAYMVWTIAQNSLYEKYPDLRPHSLDEDPCEDACLTARREGWDAGYAYGRAHAEGSTPPADLNRP